MAWTVTALQKEGWRRQKGIDGAAMKWFQVGDVRAGACARSRFMQVSSKDQSRRSAHHSESMMLFPSIIWQTAQGRLRAAGMGMAGANNLESTQPAEHFSMAIDWSRRIRAGEGTIRMSHCHHSCHLAIPDPLHPRLTVLVQSPLVICRCRM